MSFPTTGLAAEYLLDGHLRDTVGSADLTLVNSPVFAAGKIGQGLDLESSSSQYATAGASSLIRNQSKLSIEAWVKPESLSDYRAILAWQSTTVVETRTIIALGGAGVGDSNECHVTLSNGASAGGYTSGLNLFSNGAWAHIVVAYDGTFTDGDAATQNAGRLKVYVNGVSRSLTYYGVGGIPASTSNAASHPLQIGQAGNQTGFDFDGVVDIVRIWTGTTLTSDDVTYLRNGGLGRSRFGGLGAGPMYRAAMSPAFSPTNVPAFLLGR